jgi:hypothetical protein
MQFAQAAAFLPQFESLFPGWQLCVLSQQPPPHALPQVPLGQQAPLQEFGPLGLQPVVVHVPATHALPTGQSIRKPH